MKHWIYILAAVVLGISSCIPEPLDLELDEYKPKVVVASQVLPGEVMIVGLTRSFTVLSSAGFNGEGDSATFENLLVDSALVTIAHGGDVDTLFKLTPGLFASIQTLDNPGTNYTLKVVDYGLDTFVTASAEMLEQIKFDTVYPEVIKNPGDTTVKIHVKWTDPVGDANYYMVNMYNRQTLDQGLDLNSYFANGSNKVEATKIYSDKQFNSSTVEYTFDLEEVGPKDSVAVTLSNISKGYYEFLLKRQKSGSLISEITNEAINYPSNVNGGLGFFNTHFPDVEYFDLNEH